GNHNVAVAGGGDLRRGVKPGIEGQGHARSSPERLAGRTHLGGRHLRIVWIIVEPAHIPTVVGQRQQLRLHLVGARDVRQVKVLGRIGRPLGPCACSEYESKRKHRKNTDRVFHGGSSALERGVLHFT